MIVAVGQSCAIKQDKQSYHNITVLISSIVKLEEQAKNMFIHQFEFVQTVLDLNGKWVYSGLGIDAENASYVTAFEKGYWIYTFNNGAVTELYNHKTSSEYDMYVKLNDKGEYLLFIDDQIPSSSNYMCVSPSEDDSNFMGILSVNSSYEWLLGFNRE